MPCSLERVAVDCEMNIEGVRQRLAAELDLEVKLDGWVVVPGGLHEPIVDEPLRGPTVRRRHEDEPEVSVRITPAAAEFATHVVERTRGDERGEYFAVTVDGDYRLRLLVNDQETGAWYLSCGGPAFDCPRCHGYDSFDRTRAAIQEAVADAPGSTNYRPDSLDDLR